MTAPLARCGAVLLAVALVLGCARPKPIAGTGSEAAPVVWESVPLGADAEFNDVWFADTLNGWIVGGSHQIEGGLVGRTRDGGRTWSFTRGLAPPDRATASFRFTAVRFHDASRGVAVGSGGRIFLTEDGGDHWRLVRPGRSMTDHLGDLDFVDRWTGWAVGLGGVLRTTDGGETWEAVMRSSYEHDDRPSGNAIQFIDSWRGWLVGPGGRVMRTTDAGETWARVPTPLAKNERPNLYDVCFVDREHGWVVGEDGVILHTSNGGVDWVRQQTGVEGAKSKPVRERIEQRRDVVLELDLGGRTPGLTLTSVRFLDAEHGWITGHFGYEARSVVLHTDDGGAHWTVEAEVGGEELHAVFMLGHDRGWAVGDRVRPGTQVLLRHTPASEPGI